MRTKQLGRFSYFWALSMVSILSGCSALGVGQANFSCKGLPEGVSCLPVTDVYNMTSGGASIRGAPVPTGPMSAGQGVVLDGRKSKGYEIDGYDETGRPYVLNINRLPTRPMQAPVTGVQPILEPAKVVRIWIGPWRDSQNNLIFPTYLYAQVQDRQWSVRGADFERKSGVFTPVQVRSYESAEVEADE